MTFNKLLLLVGLSLSISACVAPAYKAPSDSSQTARIKAVFPQNYVLGFDLFTYENSERCSNKSLVFSYNDPSIRSFDNNRIMSWTNIPANQSVSFTTYLRYTGYRTCDVTFTMLPKVGHDYLLKVNDNKKQCGVELFDMTEQTKAYAVQRSVPSAFFTDFYTSTNKWCKK
jgi:hypothetical protein